MSLSKAILVQQIARKKTEENTAHTVALSWNSIPAEGKTSSQFGSRHT